MNNSELDAGLARLLLRVDIERPITLPGTADKELEQLENYFIHRPADGVVMGLAEYTGETLVVRGPRYTGKSQLLDGYMEKRRESTEARTVIVDFRQLDVRCFKSFPSLLKGIAKEILSQLGLPQLVDDLRLETPEDMTLFLERSVLGEVNGPLSLGMDQADHVFGQRYKKAFFTMLRNWHDERSENELFAQMDLALTISVDDSLLIDSASSSPFNVGTLVQLGPFTLEQCRTLNEQHYDLPNGQVDDLWRLLNGHPYLTHVAYSRLANSEFADVAELDAHADDDQTGPFAEHLQGVRKFLFRDEPNGLATAMRSVIRRGVAPDPTTFHWLEAEGLIRSVAVPENKSFRDRFWPPRSNAKNAPPATPANELYHRFCIKVLS